MASEEVPEYNQVLSGNGDAAGCPVSDNSGFYPGAYAWLSSDNAQQRVIIVSLISTNKVAVRFVKEPDQTTDMLNKQGSLMYGNTSDCTGFTTVLNSRLNMEKQVVKISQPQFSKLSRA